MMDWWWGGGFGWAGLFSMIFMFVFWALIIVGIVLVVRSLTTRREQESGPRTPPRPDTGAATALQLLQERYARGEIDREEYFQRKADLER